MFGSSKKNKSENDQKENSDQEDSTEDSENTVLDTQSDDTEDDDNEGEDEGDNEENNEDEDEDEGDEDEERPRSSVLRNLFSRRKPDDYSEDDEEEVKPEDEDPENENPENEDPENEENHEKEDEDEDEEKPRKSFFNRVFSKKEKSDSEGESQEESDSSNDVVNDVSEELKEIEKQDDFDDPDNPVVAESPVSPGIQDVLEENQDLGDSGESLETGDSEIDERFEKDHEDIETPFVPKAEILEPQETDPDLHISDEEVLTTQDAQDAQDAQDVQDTQSNDEHVPEDDEDSEMDSSESQKSSLVERVLSLKKSKPEIEEEEPSFLKTGPATHDLGDSIEASDVPEVIKSPEMPKNSADLEMPEDPRDSDSGDVDKEKDSGPDATDDAKPLEVSSDILEGLGKPSKKVGGSGLIFKIFSFLPWHLRLRVIDAISEGTGRIFGIPDLNIYPAEIQGEIQKRFGLLKVSGTYYSINHFWHPIKTFSLYEALNEVRKAQKQFLLKPSDNRRDFSSFENTNERKVSSLKVLEKNNLYSLICVKSAPGQKPKMPGFFREKSSKKSKNEQPSERFEFQHCLGSIYQGNRSGLVPLSAYLYRQLFTYLEDRAERSVYAAFRINQGIYLFGCGDKGAVFNHAGIDQFFLDEEEAKKIFLEYYKFSPSSLFLAPVEWQIAGSYGIDLESILGDAHENFPWISTFSKAKSSLYRVFRGAWFGLLVALGFLLFSLVWNGVSGFLDYRDGVRERQAVNLNLDISEMREEVSKIEELLGSSKYDLVNQLYLPWLVSSENLDRVSREFAVPSSFMSFCVDKIQKLDLREVKFGQMLVKGWCLLRSGAGNVVIGTDRASVIDLSDDTAYQRVQVQLASWDDSEGSTANRFLSPYLTEWVGSRVGIFGDTFSVKDEDANSEGSDSEFEQDSFIEDDAGSLEEGFPDVSKFFDTFSDQRLGVEWEQHSLRLGRGQGGLALWGQAGIKFVFRGTAEQILVLGRSLDEIEGFVVESLSYNALNPKWEMTGWMAIETPSYEETLENLSVRLAEKQDLEVRLQGFQENLEELLNLQE